MKIFKVDKLSQYKELAQCLFFFFLSLYVFLLTINDVPRLQVERIAVTTSGTRIAVSKMKFNNG